MAQVDGEGAAPPLALDKDDVAVVQELLDGLSVVSVDNLRALLEQTHAPVPADLGALDAAALRALVAAHVLQLGVTRLLQFVPKPLLRTLADAAQLGKGAHAHALERLMGSALRRFLHERLDVSALRALCVALGVEGLARDAAREASQREQQIADEVMLMGAESALLTLTAALLRVLAKELQLDAQPGAAQEALADALMAALFNLEPLDKKKLAHKQRQREEEHEARKERERERAGRKKVKRGKSRYKAPPLSNIKKGITKQELHDLYNFTDLQEYCKEHGLDYTGKKALLMRRIIAFVETGDKGAVKVPRKRKGH